MKSHLFSHFMSNQQKPKIGIAILILLLILTFLLAQTTLARNGETEADLISPNLIRSDTVELVELRTMYSKTYRWLDGSGGYALVYSSPIHSLNEFNQWIDLEQESPDDTAIQYVTDDTFAQAGYPDVPPGNQARLYLGYDTLYSKFQTRIFAIFNSPGLPSGAMISSGVAKFYQYTVEGGSYSARACRVTQNWDEYTLTWNNQPATADCQSYVSVSTSDGYKSWNITSFVQGWHNGTLSNFGIRLNTATETAPGGIYCARESINLADCDYGNWQPYLEIIFTLPPTATPTSTITPTPITSQTVTPTPTKTPTPSSTPNACVVPFFSQRNPAWKNHPLRSFPGACSSSCSTIGSCGCTLSAAAMLFKHFKTNTQPDILSDCMGNYACPFYWYKGATCSGGEAQYVTRYNFSWSQLQQELNQNHRPVLLEMKKSNGQSHWVLVISGSGSSRSNYRIHDPWELNGANVILGNAFPVSKWDLISIVVYKDIGNLSCNTFVGQAPEVLPVEPVAIEIGVGDEILFASDIQELKVSSMITGTVYVNRVEDDGSVTLELNASSIDGTITEMLIWTDTNPQGTWQAFAPYVSVPLSDFYYVIFRDDQGNISDMYNDSLYPPSSPPLEPFQIFLPAILEQ